MATTVYTPWSTAYKTSSTSTKQYRGWLTYNVTTSNTTVTVTVSSGIQQSGAMTVSYTDTQSATGQTSSTGTAAFSFSTGDTWKTAVSTKTYSWARGTSSATKTISIAVHATNAASASGWNTTTLSKSVSISVPAKPSYVVSYNVNGGSGSIANQTKWYGTNLTLSNGSGFSKTGYTLSKWNTNAAGSGTDYAKSASYTANAALALYAKWTANTYTVVYNKNNSSATGTTANSTHTYDVAKALTSNGYSLTDNLFAGWATSANGGVVYTNGQSVKNLATSGTFNLYAVWKYVFESPDIQTTTAYRCDSGGIADDSGTAGTVQAFVSPAYKLSDLTTKAYVSTRVTASYRVAGSTGAYTQLGNVQTITTPSTLTWQSGANVFDPSNQYEVRITAEVIENDAVKITSTNTTFISIAEFTVDFDENGESIGIFGVAEGKTTSGEKVVWLNGDIVMYLDNNTASGTDYEILSALTALGWDVDPD